jgi:ribosomal protein L16 Arg81 hydroxylase
MVDFGITPQEFHATLLEKRFYLRKAAHPERPFAWSDIDALLNQIEPVEPFFRLFVDGPVPAETYTREVMESGLRRRRLISDRFTRLMTGGATLVINRMEVFSVEARRLCAEVERFAGYQTTANGYITFGGQGTFGKHWDVHDVFAFQLIGGKQWKIYPPTFPYPLSNHTSAQLGQQFPLGTSPLPGLQSPLGTSPLPRLQCPATPALDCQLETGDLLYIPRGWWHQVTPLDQPSFHLSVGLFVPTVFDYAMWVMSRALPQNPSARKGLLGRECMNDLAAAMQSATAAALDPNSVAEFLKMIAEQRRSTTEIDVSLFSSLAEKARQAAPG